MGDSKKSKSDYGKAVGLRNLAASTRIPGRRAVLVAFHRWRHQHVLTTIGDREEIETHVIDEGRLTSRYSFMVVNSCAIAILGLLQSSPAVIIGAMLISPLMGPIVNFGFSLCNLNLRQTRKSLEGIGVGILMSVGISFLIVKLSPLSDPTPEILARTQPNLFDLLIAVFSGLAGGYAVIRRRGEAIVGVAIATSLMPPLAVVGYGLATQYYGIASGALLLFMTNLLAISLTVSLLARWYGFGGHHGPRYTVWQGAAVVAVFALLSIPLGLSLKDIAYQTYVTKLAKAEISRIFSTAHTRISSFSVRFGQEGDVSLDATVLTDRYAPKAETAVGRELTNVLNRKITVSLDQVILAREDQTRIETASLPTPETVLTAPATPQVVVPADGASPEGMAQEIRDLLVFPVRFIRVSKDDRRILVHADNDPAASLRVLRGAEEKLKKRFDGWNVTISPPMQAFPPILFDAGSDKLAEDQVQAVDDMSWALSRWDIKNVMVAGNASSTGSGHAVNEELALRRAKSVAALLKKAGMETEVTSEYRGTSQQDQEVEYGTHGLQRVEVRPTASPALLLVPRKQDTPSK